MQSQTFIGTVLTAIIAGAAVYHQSRGNDIIDNEEQVIALKYTTKGILTIKAPLAKRIRFGALRKCVSLKEANFPQATSIGNSALYGCTSLKETNCPKATSIGYGAFEECIQLKEANFPEATSIGNYGFHNCVSLKKANFAELVSIGEAAFSNCTSLKVGYFPQATSIGSSAFYGCTSLKETNCPKSTSIGSFGFRYCTSLEEANFPELVSIDTGAFKNCTSLKVGYFPKATSIGDGGFTGCYNLQMIILPDTLFNAQGEITNEWKKQKGIMVGAKCVRHSDYLKSIGEINNVIGQERFREGDDKILEFQLFREIHVYAVPSTLSEDEKSIFINCPASDVYKIVRSIDDYERKKQWARFLGIGEDVLVVNETLDTELDRAIIKYQDPLYEYLTGDDVKNLRRTRTSGDVNLGVDFIPHDDRDTQPKKRQKSAKLEREINSLAQRDINIQPRDEDGQDLPRKKPQAKPSP